MASQADRCDANTREATDNRSGIHGFYGPGQEDTSRPEPFTYDADHPAVLVGTNQGPTPVEFLLHAIVVAPIVAAGTHAAAHAYGYWPAADLDGYHWYYGDALPPAPSPPTTALRACSSAVRRRC